MKNLWIVICIVGSWWSVMVQGQNNLAKPDLLYKKNKTTLEVLVEEVSDTEVLYRKVGSSNGPLYAVPKSELLKIVYNNGEVEQLNEGSDSSKSAQVSTVKAEQKKKASSAENRPPTPIQNPKPGFYFGSSYGLAVSTISTMQGAEKPKVKVDQNGGLTLGYSRKINIQLDILLTSTGFNISSEVPSLGKVSTKTQTWRLMSPLLFGMYLGNQKGVYLQAGGFGSYFLSGKQTIEIPGQKTQNTTIKFDSNTPGRIEYGGVGALGYANYNERGKRTFFELRWYHGLGNDTGITNSGGFLRMATFNLGYAF